MKTKTRILTAILASLLVTSAAVIGVSAAKESQSEIHPIVTVEGKTVKFPDQLFSKLNTIIKNDRTLVPIRFIAESLGYDVEWNAEDNAAVIDDGRIFLYIGTQRAVIDGVETELDVASELIADRTMVPLRVVAETLTLS